MIESQTGFFHPKRFFKSVHYALYGIWHVTRYNQNMRFHLSAAFVVIVFSIIFRISGFEMGILGVMILLVICAEMINTALEEMVDLITTEHRQQAKIAKDVAAGMVLLTAIGSLIVGFLIFTPHILKLFGIHL